MTIPFRPEIADLIPYQPGKPAEELMRERGLESVIKLASNEGPWGPLAGAAQVISNGISALNRYPDGSCVLLKQALADRHGVSVEQIAVGQGADAIINNMSFAILSPGDEVVCAWPSFPSYVLDARKMGVTAVMVPLNESYEHDLDAMRAAITDRTRLVYVCNPNNPTGTMVGRDELIAFVRSVPQNVLCVIDEAYSEYVIHADYTDSIAEIVPSFPDNVVVLRTFSKIFGLAGLRVGYAVAPPAVVLATEKVRNAFDVTSLAQAAAIASIAELDQLERRIEANQQGLLELRQALEEVGVHPVPSVANFLCVPLTVPVDTVYDKLLDQGVIVRPLAPFGMPDAIRITVGTPDENERAAAALQTVLPALARA